MFSYNTHEPQVQADITISSVTGCYLPEYIFIQAAHLLFSTTFNFFIKEADHLDFRSIF